MPLHQNETFLKWFLNVGFEPEAELIFSGSFKFSIFLKLRREKQ